jgi:hypothetical protein
MSHLVNQKEKIMQVSQIEIDNRLIDNAVRVSGLYNKKALIEKALLFFTQQQIKAQKILYRK